MTTINNAFGNFAQQALPFTGLGAGLITPWGTLIPPGIRAPIYLRSTGVEDGDDQEISRRIVPTLADALKQVRSGKGDTVVVLPGHTENVADATMLDNLVNGTRIIGAGDPFQDDAPTFTWTAAGGSWALDNKNVLIHRLRLLLDGADGITKAINITAAGCSLANNYIRVATSSVLHSAIALEVGSGATDCRLVNNKLYGVTGQPVTNGINVVGATVPTGLVIAYNDIDFAATEINGNINVTVAALGIRIIGNNIYNSVANSTANIVLGAAASTGIIAFNSLATLNNGTVTAQGIIAGSTSLVRCFQNYSCDEPRASGTLQPAAGT